MKKYEREYHQTAVTGIGSGLVGLMFSINAVIYDDILGGIFGIFFIILSFLCSGWCQYLTFIDTYNTDSEQEDTDNV